MADIRVKIFQQYPEFIKVLEKMGIEGMFPHLLQQVEKASYMYLKLWRNYASGASIPGTTRTISVRTGAYLRSIQLSKKSQTRHEIYTDSPLHKTIEEGSPERDMKPDLLGGPKARTSKDGAKYNIIPFRHGVPGTTSVAPPMPLNVYTFMKPQKTAVSSRLDKANKAYQWGSKLAAARGGKAGTAKTGAGEYTWKTGKFTGMVRMQTSTTKAKRSMYMTFRVVSSKSDPASWIYPEREAIPIRAAVVKEMEPVLVEMLQDAIEEDLK